MAMGRDTLGVAHWCAFGAGLLLIAVSRGDPAHLRCLLYAGVILAAGLGVAIVLRWGFVTRCCPGGVIPISDAPSAVALAVDNARRIDILDLRTHDLLCVMNAVSLEARTPRVPSVPRNAVILQFPADRARSGGDTQAG